MKSPLADSIVDQQAKSNWGLPTRAKPPDNFAASPNADVVVRGIKPVDSPVRVDSIVDAASLNAWLFAPGELILICGNGFGAAPRVSAGDLEFRVLESTNTTLWALVPDTVEPRTQRLLTVEVDGNRSQEVRAGFASCRMIEQRHLFAVEFIRRHFQSPR